MTPDRDYRFKLDDGVSAAGLDAFCDGSHDFLQLPRLLSKFKENELDHAAESTKLLRRASMLKGGVLENRVLNTCCKKDPKTMILIWDTGASFGLTPFQSNFIDYVKCDIPVRDVTKVNRVIGIGTTLNKFVDTKGQEVFLPCVSYHLTQTDVCLFSPQTCHQMHGGYSEVHSN
jgi:hypothetical protein